MQHKSSRSRSPSGVHKFSAENLLSSHAAALKSPRLRTAALRVLAFDPGFERLGVAVLEKENGKEILKHSECVHTSPSLSFPERLLELGEAAEKLIKKFKPSAVALEKVYFENNAKTAMQIAGVTGMLSYIASKNKLPVLQYTPLEVKVAVTGYGKSDKRAVGLMVSKLVVLPVRKRLDDELDAIAIGLTCLANSRYPHSK
ncbi:crossover junction endodeoxyribonuclease RuvC [Acetobacteraceae bacterium]|nr:crossover junction endodeoxyribonuclease RuvC [Candidatus Parcubacteria bacterium]